MNPLPVLIGLSFKSLLHGRRLAVPILLGGVPVLLSALLVWVRLKLDFSTLTPGALYRFLLTDYFHPFLILNRYDHCITMVG